MSILEDCFWAKGANGTVTVPPEAVQQIAGDWKGASRVVNTPRGSKTFYWIQFDERQMDPDGDGPFFGAELDAVYLLPGSGTSPQTERIPDEDVEAVWYENKTIGLRVEFKAFVKREVPKDSNLNGSDLH